MSDSKKKTLVLLDSHAILHRAFHALPSFTSPQGEPTGALYGFVSMLLKIIKELKPDYLAACFDLPEPTFRHVFYEKYKAKRPKMADELSSQITHSKKILEALDIPFYEKVGFEADDVLASIVEKVKNKKNIKTIIVTGDLDTLQLVHQKEIQVFTMKKGIHEAILYDEKAVKERYSFSPELLPDFKGLMGDPSDNIIGVQGIGEKTAKTLIQNFGSLENLYKKLKKDKKAFEKAGIKERIIKILEENEEEAFFSKSLAEVRKDVPLSFVLSDTAWSSNMGLDKAEELFRNFGFRTLLTRLSSFLKDKPKELKTDEKTEKELKLAFWVLDSRRINSTPEDILAYTGVSSLAEAKNVLEKDIKKNGLSKIFYEIELPLINIFQDAQKKGILLDVGYLKKLSKDYHKRLKKLEEQIWKLCGCEFNISSPKQLSEVLFEKLEISTKGVRRTGQGTLSTRFSELEKIKDRHPVINKIFSYRELAKLTSTYIDNLPKLVNGDNRLHTIFNQAGTTTGRISSSKPNLQNIPVRTDFGKAVRRAFLAPRGWQLFSFDYSQIELRVAAVLSEDRKLKQAFKKSRDIHTEVAAEVFNVPFEKVDSEMRRKAKIINFGIIYGMGINTLRKNLKCAREEAEIFYHEYFNDFSGMNDYLDGIKKEVKKNGFSSTMLGRRRYLPEINSPIEYIRKEAERMAINAPIQGTAADIIKIAMAKVSNALKTKKFLNNVNLLLQVHDELLFEIRNDIIKEAVPLIKQIMENAVDLEIPLLVDVFAGKNWGSMKNIYEGK